MNPPDHPRPVMPDRHAPPYVGEGGQRTPEQVHQYDLAYRAYHDDLRAWWAQQAGVRLVEGWAEGAGLFCAECAAGGSLLGEPIRGKDSYGDCAEDGERLSWAMPLESVQTPT